jgi:hypothetical protein
LKAGTDRPNRKVIGAVGSMPTRDTDVKRLGEWEMKPRSATGRRAAYLASEYNAMNDIAACFSRA